MFPVPQIDYVTVFGLLGCGAFFAEAARQAGLARIVGASCSIAAWLLFTQFVAGGMLGLLLSQLLLFVGWGAVGIVRDQLAARNRR